MDPYFYARLGYEAYAQSTGGKTYDGRNMPRFDELPIKIKEAWSAAADKIRFPPQGDEAR